MGFLKIAVILFFAALVAIIVLPASVLHMVGKLVSGLGELVMAKVHAASSYNSSVNGSGTALGLGPPAPLNLTNGTKVTKKAANPNVIINVS
jgi:hypothetical protein